jgi:hypothetical protein
VQVFIAKSARVLAIVIIVAMALALLSIFATDGITGVIQSISVVALVCYGALMLFWFPQVEVSEEVVVIKNVLRSYRIPISAIARIDTRWALALYLPGGKRITSWSATAPGRHASIFASRDLGQHLPESTYLAGTVRPGDLVNTDSGAAAATIRRYWEAQQERGSTVTEKVSISWHKTQLLVLVGLLVLSYLSF